MRNITVDICNKINMLDVLVDGLDGKLPYMTSSEKEEYNNYSEEINQNYDCVIAKIKELVPQESQDKIINVVKQYAETCTCRNALLNDLYYKDGVRDGICFLLECFRSE